MFNKTNTRKVTRLITNAGNALENSSIGNEVEASRIRLESLIESRDQSLRYYQKDAEAAAKHEAKGQSRRASLARKQAESWRVKADEAQRKADDLVSRLRAKGYEVNFENE